MIITKAIIFLQMRLFWEMHGDCHRFSASRCLSDFAYVIRAILHDDRVFDDPEAFKPERFIENPALPDPSEIGVFGFGRR